jgi:hypothetical protein
MRLRNLWREAARVLTRTVEPLMMMVVVVMMMMMMINAISHGLKLFSLARPAVKCK